MTPIAYKIPINIELENKFTSVGSSDDPMNLFDGEYKINTVRVITFDGEVLDQNLYIPAINSEEKAILIKMNVSERNGKFVYVLVNEPEEFIGDLNELKSRDDLKKFEYSIASYFAETGAAFSLGISSQIDFGFSGLPMSGSMIIENLIAETIYPITVHRTVARVDVWLRGDKAGFELTAGTATELGSALVYNTSEKGDFFDKKVTGVIPTAATLVNGDVGAKNIPMFVKKESDEVGRDGNYRRVFTYYTPERTSLDDTSRLRFTITGVRYNKSPINASQVVLLTDNKGPVNEIKRNHVYSVYCTIKGTGALNVDHEVRPWDTVEIDIPTFE